MVRLSRHPSEASVLSRVDERLHVARAMYRMRFPGEDVSVLTMQQLRGREGARVRRLYRQEARRTGVSWSKREYDPENFDGSDEINQALTAANASLYGMVHAVITALGCSPGLGFIHSGTDRAFVYDVADLYKADITIPVAFEITAERVDNIGSEVRRAVRDRVVKHRLLERCARDISLLLGLGEEPREEWLQDDSLSLWSGSEGAYVPSGVSYMEPS